MRRNVACACRRVEVRRGMDEAARLAVFLHVGAKARAESWECHVPELQMVWHC